MSYKCKHWSYTGSTPALLQHVQMQVLSSTVVQYFIYRHQHMSTGIKCSKPKAHKDPNTGIKQVDVLTDCSYLGCLNTKSVSNNQ